MDKSSHYTYRSENRVLTVERHFTGDGSIEELVKQYVLEQAKKTTVYDGPDKENGG